VISLYLDIILLSKKNKKNYEDYPTTKLDLTMGKVSKFARKTQEDRIVLSRVGGISGRILI